MQQKKVQKSQGKSLKGQRTMHVFERADMRQETRPQNARSALFKQHQRTKMIFINIVTVRVINLYLSIGYLIHIHKGKSMINHYTDDSLNIYIQ